MGYLRFILACIVVLAHSEANIVLPTIGGLCGVQLFFMISGFYMAAAYSKYYMGKGGAINFLVSRFIRLYPCYVFAIGFTFCAYLICKHFHVPYNHLLVFDFFEQPTNLLQKIISGTLYFQDILSLSEKKHHLLPVRQSWSIGAELAFYLFVPFLIRLKDPKKIAVFLLTTLIAKIAIFSTLGFRWSYYPFFSNLCYFYLGFFLFPYRAKLEFNKKIAYCMLVSLCVLSAFFGPSELEKSFFKNFFIVASFTICLPTLFKEINSKLDRFLGDLSYGIYMFHLVFCDLVISIGFTRQLNSLTGNGFFSPLVTFSGVLLISSLLAAAFEFGLQKRIDTWRRKQLYTRQENDSTNADDGNKIPSKQE